MMIHVNKGTELALISTPLLPHLDVPPPSLNWLVGEYFTDPHSVYLLYDLVSKLCSLPVGHFN